MDRREWEKNKLSSAGHSPGELWKSVKGILGWNRSGPPIKLFHEGKYVTSPKGLATILNSFFIDKVKRLRRSIPVVGEHPLSKPREAMANRTCTFKMKKVTKQEVLNTITGLNSSSSTGIDYIDVGTIKLVKHKIGEAL